MAPVSTAPPATTNAWTCPTCRHGSPDPRDEAAHLDAHRQLGQFLRDWDAAVVSDRRKERRRPMALVLGALALVIAVAAGVVFWGLGPGGDASRPATGPAGPGASVPVAPVDPAPPAPPPAVTPVPEVPAVPAPAPAPVAPAPAPQPDAAPPVALAPPADEGPAAVATTPPEPAPSVDAPSTPAPAQQVSQLEALNAGPPVPPPDYILRVCLLNTCLKIP